MKCDTAKSKVTEPKPDMGRPTEIDMIVGEIDQAFDELGEEGSESSRFYAGYFLRVQGGLVQMVQGEEILYETKPDLFDSYEAAESVG